jgi:UDP-N-acetylmuramyl pentapeptide phosphotransferase/UDP-N-acetylglucosamine-1-phosphate transferase
VPFLVPPLVACCLTALLIVLLRRPAERLRLIDHPGGRKRHSHPVPLTGGIALTLGFYAALLLSFGAIGWRAGVAEPLLFGAYLAAGLVYFAAFIRPRWLIRRYRRGA